MLAWLVERRFIAHFQPSTRQLCTFVEDAPLPSGSQTSTTLVSMKRGGLLASPLTATAAECLSRLPFLGGLLPGENDDEEEEAEEEEDCD